MFRYPTNIITKNGIDGRSTYPAARPDFLPPAYAVLTRETGFKSESLLFAFYNGARLVRARKLQATHFGAAYFIPTVYVPLLLITHGLIFWIMLKVGAH